MKFNMHQYKVIPGDQLTGMILFSWPKCPITFDYSKKKNNVISDLLNIFYYFILIFLNDIFKKKNFKL